MIYDSDDRITIRTMEKGDPERIFERELEQGHHTTVERFFTRLRDQAEGKAVALVAEYRGQLAGYNNVYSAPPCAGPFEGKGYGAIIDFGVFATYRRHGIGGRLMDVAEKVAAEIADTVFLSVGLHSGYGSAQRMYVKRGYLPDGSGAWYRDRNLEPYAGCLNDDLVLYLSKKLR